MARRNRSKKFFFYECSLTGEKYKVTREAPNPDELMSVAAYYQLHPENDDRPAHIKAQLNEEEES